MIVDINKITSPNAKKLSNFKYNLKYNITAKDVLILYSFHKMSFASVDLRSSFL